MWATGGGGGHSGILTGEQRLLPVFLTRPLYCVGQEEGDY